MNNRSPMTVNGHKHIKAELERLKREDRPKVIQDIAEARAHGDLKENAEYHAAREQQGLIEARIKDLEAKISNCHVIDPSQLENNGKVVFGSTVELLNIDTDETVTYQIVGVDEADIKIAKISYTSPIARGIMGKFSGDLVDIATPQAVIKYEITDVIYG